MAIAGLVVLFGVMGCQIILGLRNLSPAEGGGSLPDGAGPDGGSDSGLDAGEGLWC